MKIQFQSHKTYILITPRAEVKLFFLKCCMFWHQIKILFYQVSGNYTSFIPSRWYGRCKIHVDWLFWQNCRTCFQVSREHAMVLCDFRAINSLFNSFSSRTLKGLHDLMCWPQFPVLRILGYHRDYISQYAGHLSLAHRNLFSLRFAEIYTVEKVSTWSLDWISKVTTDLQSFFE